jgi:hypothetical protein
MAVVVVRHAVGVPVSIAKLDRRPLATQILAQIDAVDRIEEWFLAVNCGTLAFPLNRILATRNGTVGDSTVGDNPVVPENNTSRLPLPAHCQIVCGVEISFQYSRRQSYALRRT